MRKLTFYRMKTTVGAWSKLRVYVEDPYESDLTISGVPCRFLGAVKNGGSAEFEIPESRCKIFTIVDRLSKEFCNDMYQLEAGSEPVTVSGSFTLQPVKGNVFRFNNNNSQEAQEHHDKIEKKRSNSLILWIIVLVSLGLIGKFLAEDVFTGAKKEQVFTHGEFSITLSNQFRETEYEGYDACYDSLYVFASLVEERFDEYEDLTDYSLDDYGQALLEVYELEGPMSVGEFYQWCDYEETSDDGNETYCFRTYIYKGNEAFWLLTFGVEQEKLASYEPNFHTWASSVQFGAEQ